jgi:hypothetical protein
MNNENGKGSVVDSVKPPSNGGEFGSGSVNAL